MKILNRLKKGRIIRTGDFRQADFSLFSKRGGAILWNAAMKGKGAQESWQFLKDSRILRYAVVAHPGT